ncbi:MAG TPA: YbaB/EbfC family nucleoid-associated protein [Candidatus Cloacimonetes bacterium]|nr:YbaB/EbfC family nucleoid-associated protein [Candidatus Cloacimonadota bacterium]
MLPGGKNMNQLMKQAQKMQQEMMKSQQELEETVFEASSGGGMVTIEMNGSHEIVSVKIDPEVVDPDDVEMLEDLILAAFQEVHKKVSETTGELMGKLTGGMKIPGLF